MFGKNESFQLCPIRMQNINMHTVYIYYIILEFQITKNYYHVYIKKNKNKYCFNYFIKYSVMRRDWVR